MERSPSWEANSHSACQETPRICETRRYITVFTTSHNCPYHEMNLVHTLYTTSLRFILILSSHIKYQLTLQEVLYLQILRDSFYCINVVLLCPVLTEAFRGFVRPFQTNYGTVSWHKPLAAAVLVALKATDRRGRAVTSLTRVCGI